MSFQCTVVTPEQQALDESAEQVVLPAHDGQLGILTGRAPLLVKLGVGPMRVDLAGGGRKLFLVDGGVAEMKDDKLTVLPRYAVARRRDRRRRRPGRVAEGRGRAAGRPRRTSRPTSSHRPGQGVRGGRGDEVMIK